MNTPKIRFKGFTDDWEQRKVSDLLQERNEQAPRSEEYPLMAFIADQGVAPKGERYDRSALVNDENGKKYKRTEYGDFIYSSNNLETGSIGLNKYGNASISPVYSIFKRTSNVDLDFLGRRFLRKDFINEMVKWRQGVVYGQWKIHESDFLKINVVVPSIEEQKRIGHCFEKLDYLITLHQRKCDETKQLKKFMLQKMFPKNGEKNPEIRFEGFTDDWEQRKLGDVFEQTTNFVDPNKKEIELWSLTVEDGLTPKSERYNREFLVKKDTGFKEVRSGDIVYNPMNMTLGAVGYNGMSKSVAVSGYYTTMITNEGYDSYYINTWLKSPQAMALYKTFATGSLIEKQRVQFPTLSIIPATFPQYEEQVRIGYYFMRLDHLITLHQRKCEKLKELKKYMLQNMFV
ncbi:restriction endonuclease subunit S [Clostridium sp. AF43-10]|nr:restriction endonuclease subunit S [Clostridium sp. AF43-10]